MFSRLIDGGLRFLDQERLVRASGFLDAEWYSDRYPEAGGATNALVHFLRTGAGKGYDPGPTFSTNGYLSDYPDVREAGANALVHYLRFGRHEGRVARDTNGRVTGSSENGLDDKALALVKQAFDAEFYQATNPDLAPNEDGFAHFLGPGWFQRRDPVAWFSIEHYLQVHKDVLQSGSNPFAHYLLTGCREGREIAPSRRLRHGVGEARTRLRTAVVAMVRNEADIIRVFAAHVLALFDDIVIVDHRSDDGTAEYLGELAEANRRVELLRLDEPSYIQSVTMTHVIRDRPQLREADWVFFLDVDEFLPFADRATFDEALTRFGGCPVISMRWQNLIPATYWDAVVSIDDETDFLVPPTPSPFCKIAFQPRRISLDRTMVSQGNHALSETLNGLELAAFDADFPLLHLPVRSVEQILLKLNQGVLAYQKIGFTRDSAQGTHWFKMKQATGGATLSPEHLNALADRYSETKDAIVPLSRTELMASGYREARVTLAQSEDAIQADIPRRNFGEALMRLYAVDYTGAATEDLPGATRLETHGTNLTRADGEAEYATLRDNESTSPEFELNDVVSALFRPSYQEIEDLVASDWAGHIPFMIALTTMAAPRRFVDLGTLRGTSLFAFAQAARRAGLDSEAIAVSAWAVEPDCAEDFSRAYDDFRFIARKYADLIGLLRMAPDDALHRFSDRSVDLLHLDGFRSYEGISAGFSAWQSKLSSRGLVLVHDINAHGDDFGIWRFWDELKVIYPTIEFRHAQGLGLALVGMNASPMLAKLAEVFAEDGSLRSMMDEHFERMGALSAELFSRRYDMAQIEARAGAEGAQAEELSWLRQELASTQSEADELRKLVQGELRHAAGG